jgi:dipeptidyl-peptidase-4
VVSVDGGPVRWIDISAFDSAEPLIARVTWTTWTGGRARVVYALQNREQTWLELFAADPESGASQSLLRESRTNWVEALDVPHRLSDGSFLWLSDRTGSRRVYRITLDGTSTALTNDSWDVRKVEAVDEGAGWVYCTATDDSGLGIQLYRAGLDGSAVEQVTKRPGNHSVSFSDNRRYFIDTFSDVHTPPQTWLYTASGEPVRAIEPNLVDHLRHYRVNRPEFLQVAARDGMNLDAMLIRPPDFDPAKRYPVLCYVYSGPQTPVVWDRWGGQTYLWHQMLAQHGYVIWLCDNRSASRRGVATALPIHGRLGECELEDIEDGLAWLKSQPWVDSERIGIWGWSYGGYMTCYALTHSKLFKVGIAGAPVTDWHNYDSIYTERYMGLPRLNPEGYRKSSPLVAADSLHGRLLLVHGTVDDNVHLSNTIQFAAALQRSGKQFEMMLYPKSRHSVTDPSQLRHMRELMTRFILSNL